MKKIVAIDWGACSATVAVGERYEDGKLHILGVSAQPMSGGVIDGEVVNFGELQRATQKAVNELNETLNITIDGACLSISGAAITCDEKRCSLPVDGQFISQEDIDRLHEMMRRMSAVDAHSYTFDRISQKYTAGSRDYRKPPVMCVGRNVEVVFNLIHHSKGDSVQLFSKSLSNMGIHSVDVFTAPQASAEAVLSSDERGEFGAVVADIGAESIKLSVWKDNVARYMSVTPIGTYAIDKDLKEIGIPEKAVEPLKTQFGYASPSFLIGEAIGEIKVKHPRTGKTTIYYAEKMATVIEARLMDFIEIVKSEIADSGYAGKLGGVVLTGGGANMKYIAELFERELNMSVRRGGIEREWISDDTDSKFLKPEYATAVGVLLMAINKGYASDNEYQFVTETTLVIEEPPVEDPPLPTNDDKKDGGEETPKKNNRKSFGVWIKGAGKTIKDAVAFPVIQEGAPMDKRDSDTETE